MQKLHLDFETFSELDVRSTGAWKYAEHPSTEVLCLFWAIGDMEPVRWLPEDPLPSFLDEPDNYTHIAHNAGFERAIWSRVCEKKCAWPKLPSLDKWVCSAAKAAAHSLPRDLSRAGTALDLPIQKDDKGHRVMLKLCKPRRPSKNNPKTRWFKEDVPEDYEVLYSYCGTDVGTERCLDEDLRDLSPMETKIWQLDQRINARGVCIDMEAVRGAFKIIEAFTQELNAEIYDLTEGKLNTITQILEARRWILSQMEPLDVFADIDEIVPSLDKAHVQAMLDRDDIPANVRRFLEIRQTLSKTSTKKLWAMEQALCSDGRIRDTLMYHGASTGRWSGKFIQVQNLPRGNVKDPDQCIELIRQGNMAVMRLLYDNPMEAISSCLRGMIMAPEGKDIIAADFSAIEAVVLAWLSGQEDVLDQFRQFFKGTGKEPYCIMAEAIYAREIDKHKDPVERGVGKVGVLQLGFQGGIGAFGSMAKTTGIDLQKLAEAIAQTATVEEVEKAKNNYEKYYAPKVEDPLPPDQGIACDIVKQRWRLKNPKTVEMWSAQEDAAIQAMQAKKPITCGPVLWAYLDNFLFCKLPSGRCLAYRDPKIKMTKTPWGAEKYQLSFMSVDSMTKQWRRKHTYGGELVENITQATARDIMAGAMLRVEENGYPIIFTVHDEVISEIDETHGNVREYEQILSTPPSWGPDIPIKAEGWRGKRYRKG